MTHCAIFTQSDSGPQGLAFGDSLEAARSGRLVGASAGRDRRETESLVSVSQNTRHRAHRSRAARDWCPDVTQRRFAFGAVAAAAGDGHPLQNQRTWLRLIWHRSVKNNLGQRALSFEAPRAK
jgi:hypothetical protein